MSPEVARAFRAFTRVSERVQEAKETLVLGVPSGRAPRLPLAEALAGFEAGIAEAHAEMGQWRIASLETEWLACSDALREAAGRADRLRRGGGPGAYEQLAPVLDELLDPLGAFAEAGRRFRQLGA
jgi:hypothetical protein